MMFLERLAESKIRQARDAGDLDNLPGSGQRIPEETDMQGVAPSIRVAYRIMKNAGYIPGELQLRQEISEINSLLRACEDDNASRAAHRKRLNLLLGRLDGIRSENLILQEAYFRRVSERFAGKRYS